MWLCRRYRDYRNADDYSYTVEFWHIFAARLAFLILFEVSRGGGRGAAGGRGHGRVRVARTGRVSAPGSSSAPLLSAARGSVRQTDRSLVRPRRPPVREEQVSGQKTHELA